MDVTVRALTEDDYPAIISRVDLWWGRPVAGMLPRLFLRHFHRTSLVAVDEDDAIVGFLVGFLSPDVPDEAHTHFVAVSPEVRESGLGTLLYRRFFDIAREAGRSRVTAVVSPVNTVSQRFHQAVGFRAKPLPGQDSHDGTTPPVWPDWDGPGQHRTRFEYAL
ncbi:GNAT family N-acetyltransferase [Umezawaea tangerina]|uniref:Ribosomal protein S18 acetylase RimI-like enzyme n=1 Tax=Umezawaea tangerina TaxID=84725 RepID=A0A2T0STQ2_9PSEU|nr:GNAT family N-acetyltransferase [Umezawaea tangerina]PRY36801.1 ribosomal protein S18 acetylase RimI-like enzyme [Umezawaea tangerina]